MSRLAFLTLLAVFPAGAQRFDLAALRAFAALTPDQWKTLEYGNVQVAILDTPLKREVAAVGAAYLRASAACLVAQFQDIGNFKKSPAVLKIRKMATPVRPQDLQELSLDVRALTDLRQCRAGNCNVKLPARAVRRLGSEVDWSRPDHVQLVQSIVREELLAYINTYLRHGNTALIHYHDKIDPVSLEDEFREVLRAKPGLADLIPQLDEYLGHYPAQALPGVNEFIYWSTEKFGVKPVVSVTHVSLYVQPGQAVIASKQVYASHYFDASLGVTVALNHSSVDSRPGMYLVYLNRSRVDAFSGFFGGLRRAISRGRLRDGMHKNLTELVHRVEAACAHFP